MTDPVRHDVVSLELPTPFVPVKALAYWDLLEPVVRPAVEAAAARSDRDANALYPPAAAFALWAWQSRGMPPEGTTIFRQRVINEFIHRGMPNHTRASRATYRSALTTIAEAVTPTWDASAVIPRSAPTAPYSAQEVARLVSWARSQRNEDRRVDARVLLALGLGAGLTTIELLNVRTRDIDWRDGQLVVQVWSSRPRLVPVDPQWAGGLLAVREHNAPDEWAFRRTRRGVRAPQVTDFLHRHHHTEIDVRPVRMRTTWLVSHLRTSTPPRELLRISGLKNMAALDRLTPFLTAR